MAWRRAQLSRSADPSVLLSPGKRSSLRQKLTLLGDVGGQWEVVRTTVPRKSTFFVTDRAPVPVAPAGPRLLTFSHASHTVHMKTLVGPLKRVQALLFAAETALELSH